MSVASNATQPPTYELEPYQSLDPAELTARIEAVRREWGKRLVILGHHYQQDEVIALADLRGDSYKLSELAAASEDCRGDRVLRRPLHGRDGRHPGEPARAIGRSATAAGAGDPARPGGRLLDGRHGRDRPGRGLLASSSPTVIDTEDVTPVTYINSAAELEGVLRAARRDRLHVGQRRRGAPSGPWPGEAACCSFPISTWAATRRCGWAFRRPRCRSGTRTGDRWAATPSRRSATAA